MKYLEINPDKLEQALRQSAAASKNNQQVVVNGEKFSYDKEIDELVKVAKLIQALPKKDIIRPVKRYKFQEVGATTYLFWPKLVSNLRLAVIPLVLVFILSGGGLVVQATENSLPGDRLYALKRAKEEARLSLTLNEEKVAHLHIEYAQKRLEEVKKVMESNNSRGETIAIAALKEQTEKALAEVSKIAVSSTDQSLIENLTAINKDQQTLLASRATASDNQEITRVALDSAKEQEKTLARIIASVNEQAWMNHPNKVTVTGLVEKSTDKQITVEKTDFIITGETNYINQSGDRVEIAQIGTSNKVTVIGTKNDQNVITARQIQIHNSEKTDIEPVPAPVNPNPVVKGIITTKPSTTTTKPATNTDTASADENSEIPTQPVFKENEASAGFIVEPSERQYTGYRY